MEKILERIESPTDLRGLSFGQKKQLAKEIRQLILEVVAKNGGHLASNLGVVELTLALCAVYDLPKDKIVWDVGHQTYAYKILTGRREQFRSLRELSGLAGFPKREESEYDCFNTGHSSTAISAAVGLARGLKARVVAVVGDGALTGGMAQEALNDAAVRGTNLVMILNDNGMSIGQTVGGVAAGLRGAGDGADGLVERAKLLGWKYVGPVDGHDLEVLERVLREARAGKGPILVHVLTQKGKGYKPAEERPEDWHGVGGFDLATGKLPEPKRDYAGVMGRRLTELARQDKRIVAVTAAMTEGAGLSEFAREWPERLFDVGMAEQHALAMAAGMAAGGLKPVVAIYSSFYQRAYDQIIHDIALQKLPVVMCVDRAGLVGNDGETHQGVFDLAMMNLVPGLTILAPKDFRELKQMLEWAVGVDGPVMIRYPRGGEGHVRFRMHPRIACGKAEVVAEGKDLTVVALGKMVERAMEERERLAREGQMVEVINARFLKPLDEEMIMKSIKKTGKVLTMEDGILMGGLASSVLELVRKYGLDEIEVNHMGYDDEFVPQGKVEELMKMYLKHK